jgi:hypothetical protein
VKYLGILPSLIRIFFFFFFVQLKKFTENSTEKGWFSLFYDTSLQFSTRKGKERKRGEGRWEERGGRREGEERRGVREE